MRAKPQPYTRDATEAGTIPKKPKKSGGAGARAAAEGTAAAGRAVESHAGARRQTRLRRLLFLSVPYLVFLLLLVLVEVGVRLWLPHVSPLEAMVESKQQQSSFLDRERVTIFEADPLLFWRLKPNLERAVWDFTVVSTNAQGLRHEGDIGPKRPGAFRVVCVGDSVTFGYRVPVAWPERPNQYDPTWLPYPMLLEKALRAANPGRQIEVIALAVPGYTSHQGLAWLRRDIEELRPDLVTVCFGWNDIGLHPRADSELMKTGWAHVTTRRLMARSQAFTHAVMWLKSRGEEKGKAQPQTPTPAQPPTPRVPPDEYVQNIMEMARLAREHDARAVLIGPVYQDKVHNPFEGNSIAHYRERLRAAARSAGVHYLEIPELTDAGYPANVALFGELIHPNHLGHRLMAESLLKFFAEHRLLGGLNVPRGV